MADIKLYNIHKGVAVAQFLDFRALTALFCRKRGLVHV